MLAKHSTDMHPSSVISTVQRLKKDTYRGAVAKKLELGRAQLHEAIVF